MRLELYQAETARIATEQSALLAQAKQRLADGIALHNAFPDRRYKP